MKKAAALLALVCLLSLTACGKMDLPAQTVLPLPAEDPAPAAPPPPDAAGPEAAPAEPETGPAALPPDPAGLDRPPSLTVHNQYDADRTLASCYGYFWAAPMENGETAHTIACGPSPLDHIPEDNNTLYTAFPAGTLPPLEEGQFPGMLLPVFTLDFEGYVPDEVTVTRWPAQYTEAPLDHLEDGEQVAVQPEDCWTLLPNGDGDFIYEVQAAWGETGSATYVFRTLPRLRGE